MPPPKEGGQSWLVILGVIIIHLSIYPVLQSFALIYDDVFDEFNMSSVDLGLLIHINNGIASLSGLCCAPMLRQYGYRVVCLVGCSICSIAICLLSLARSWIYFVLTYGILFGIGLGTLYPSTTLAINEHFHDRRRLAVGVSVAVISLGPVVGPHIINLLLSNYGISGTVLLLGGAALHSLVGSLLLRERPLNGLKGEKVPKTENLLEMKVRSECTTDNSEVKDLVVKSTPSMIPITHEFRDPHIDTSGGKSQCSFVRKCYKGMVQTFSLDLLKDLVFVNIAFGLGLSIASEFNFQVLLPFIMTDFSKIDRTSLAHTMCVQAACDIGARVFSPWIAEWFNLSSRLAFVLSLVGASIGRTVMAYYHADFTVLILHAVVFGICKGFKAVFQSLILPEYIPLEKLPAASGLYMVINGILSLICGPLIGLIKDNSDSYVLAIHTMSVLSLLCPIAWAAEYFYQRCRKHKERSVEEGIK